MRDVLRQPSPAGWRWWLLLLALWAGLAVQVAAAPTLRAEGPSATEAPAPGVDVEVFAREGCPACAQARAYLDDLEREQPDLRVRVWDVGSDPDALTRLQSLASAQGLSAVATPTFLVRGRLVVGWAGRETTGRYLEALLAGSEPGDVVQGDSCAATEDGSCSAIGASRDAVTLPLLGTVSAGSLGLPLFTAAVGLLDGFNPCAMWVLVFLLSLLATSRSRVHMLVVAGTFVVVSGLVYFAFMAAWLNVFLLVGFTREIQVLLGCVALVAGAVNAKDFVAFGRGVSLSIPGAAKPDIYRRVNRVVRTQHLWLALAGVAALALMVNAVELLCTAGLPAIYTQVLASHGLPGWAYYGYLAFYQVFYMLDDTVMLGVGVATLSHYRLQQREGRWLKLVSGAVMLGLGGALLFQPGWLHWTA